MRLDLRSATVNNIVEYGAYLFYFTAAGVEVFDPVTRVRQAYADLAGATCGAVNSNGVYVGCATGVYFLSHANVGFGGDQTASLVLKYGASTTPALVNASVKGMYGFYNALGITTAGSVEYTPDSSGTTKYTMTIAAGAGKIAINTEYMIYESANILYTNAIPGSNWTGSTALSDVATPTYASQSFSNTTGLVSGLNDVNHLGMMRTALVGGVRLCVYASANGKNSYDVVCPRAYKINSASKAMTLVPFNDEATFHGFAGGLALDSRGYLAFAGTTGTTGNRIQLWKYNPTTDTFETVNGFVNTNSYYGAWWVNDCLILYRDNGTTGNFDLYSVATGSAVYVNTFAVTGNNRLKINNSQGHNNSLVYGSYFVGIGYENYPLLFKLTGTTITFKHKCTGGSGDELSNTISDNGVFLSRYIYSASAPTVTVFRVNMTTEQIDAKTAVTVPVTNGTTCDDIGSPVIHPYGGYICVPKRKSTGGQAPPLSFWVYKLDSNFNTTLIGLTSTGLNNVWSSYSEGITGALFAGNDCLTFIYYDSSTGNYKGMIGAARFTYDKISTPILGTKVNCIAIGYGNNAFIGTDAGLLIMDLTMFSWNPRTGLFGTSNNLTGISVDGETKLNLGIISYGTSSGDGKGQFGVINLRNNFTLATRAGDVQGAVWNSGLECVAYDAQMERIEDAVSSTRKLVLVGSSVKSICRYQGNMYHFTEAGVDVHRISDGVRVAWALVSGVTCGTVNANGVYMGTSTAGVKKLTHAAIANGLEQTAAVTTAYGIGTTPAISSNAIVYLASYVGALAIATSSGVHFLPDASTVFSWTGGGAGYAVAVDASRFAFSAGAADAWVYFGGYPTADFGLPGFTAVPNRIGAAVHEVKFGQDLFIATNDGILVADTAQVTTKAVTTELGTLRNVMTIHPTSLATKTGGLCAYGISYGNGNGKFGVLDMSNLA